MNIVLAGMRSQEAAAMEILVGKTLPGWSCQSVATLADIAQAEASLCVLDLPGLGLHRFSEAAAAQLQENLADRAAIVLYRQSDSGWPEPETNAAVKPWHLWVQKPVSASGMRDALEQVRKSSLAQTVAAPDSLTRAPAATGPIAPAAQIDPKTAAIAQPPEPSPPTEETTETAELSVAAFTSQIQQRSPEKPGLFLRALANALSQSGSFEIRLTLQHCLLVCPEEQWVASNTPMAVVHRLAGSDALAAAAHIHPVEGDAGRLLSRRAHMDIQPLDAFLWQLLNHPTP